MANETVTPTPARRPRRFGWLRVIGILFGLFLLLVVAGYFVVTSPAFLKGVILPRVGKAVNAQVTVAGADISPFSRVTFKDMRVQTTGTDPLFTAAEVRLRYDLVQIIRGNLLVEEISVQSPAVVLVENADGTSNLDPILKSQETATKDQAPPAESEEPLKVDLRKLTVSNGSVRMIKNYKGGTRDLTELSKLNLQVENVRNGQSGTLNIGSDVRVDSNPPAPGTNGVLQARLDGTFSFDLGPDLMPVSIKGNSGLRVGSATGAFIAADHLVANLDCDVTPSEIRQVLLRFAQADVQLGQVSVRGPFDLQKVEGRVFAELTGVDKRLFNIFGAPMGIDFGTTALRATNQLQIAQGGQVVTAGGELDLAGFQVIRTNLASPTLDFRAAYNITVDLNKSNAVISGLTLNGTQRGAPFLRGQLTSPMPLSWGGAENSVGDSTLTVVLTNINLADWKAFTGDATLTGALGGQLRLASQQSGNLLAYDLNSEVNNLSAAIDTNQFSNLRMVLQASGTATNLSSFRLSQYRLDASHQEQPLFGVSGNASYELETSVANAQVRGRLFLDRAVRLMPMPDLDITSGLVEMQARIVQSQDDMNLAGSVVLTNLQGTFTTVQFRNFSSTASLDIGMNSYQVQVRKADGAVSEGGRAGGTYSVKGVYNLTNETAQITARLSDFNQDGLRPFLEGMLEDKKLVSAALNGDVAVDYHPVAPSSFKVSARLANLVVEDPANPALATPLEARFGLDAGMDKDVFEIRQADLGLTPTPRATNVLQMTGFIDMRNTNAYSGSLKLTARALDFTRYYDLFQAPVPTNTVAASAPARPASPAPEPAPVEPETEPEPMVLPLTNFVVDASVAALYLRDVEITNFQSNVRINGGRLLIKPFQMAMNGAPVNSSMDLDLGVPGWKYDLAFNTAQLPLAPLVDSFQPDRRGQIGGTLTGQGRITGAGITGPSLQKSLAGNFDIGTTNLNLAIPALRSKLLKTVINVIAVVPEILRNPGSALTSLSGALFTPSGTRQSGGLVEELMQSPLDVIQARGDIASGRVNLEHSLLQSPAFQAGAAGTIVLQDILTNSTLNIPLSVSLKRSLAEKINFVPAGTPTNLAYVKLPHYVTIKGTVGEPKSDINKAALLGTALQQLGGVIPGVDQKTGALLQNLGGVLSGRGTAAGTNAPSAGTNQPAGGLLQGLGGLLAPRTNAPSGSSSTNQPQPRSSSGSLLQGLGSILAGPQPTNAPAARTNAPGTNAAPGSLLDQILRPR